jgi:hypothetical protein
MSDFTFKLTHPVKLEGGTMLSELTFQHRLSAADHLNMVRQAGFIMGPNGPMENEAEYELLRLAASVGELPETLKRLDLADYYALRQVGNDFILRQRPET